MNYAMSSVLKDIIIIKMGMYVQLVTKVVNHAMEVLILIANLAIYHWVYIKINVFQIVQKVMEM
jgi:hypothetical protein